MTEEEHTYTYKHTTIRVFKHRPDAMLHRVQISGHGIDDVILGPHYLSRKSAVAAAKNFIDKARN